MVNAIPIERQSFITARGGLPVYNSYRFGQGEWFRLVWNEESAVQVAKKIAVELQLGIPIVLGVSHETDTDGGRGIYRC